jgi:hypothetical protein
VFWLKRVRLSIRCTSWAFCGLGRDLLMVTSLYENVYLCFMEGGGGGGCRNVNCILVQGGGQAKALVKAYRVP